MREAGVEIIVVLSQLGLPGPEELAEGGCISYQLIFTSFENRR
jgi:2',3'-cyclic-nucleotide 2'-phosphodiesterase (5'-nucleotidase family)